jgi:hypothetical protein
MRSAAERLLQLQVLNSSFIVIPPIYHIWDDLEFAAPESVISHPIVAHGIDYRDTGRNVDYGTCSIVGFQLHQLFARTTTDIWISEHVWYACVPGWSKGFL